MSVQSRTLLKEYRTRLSVLLQEPSSDRGAFDPSARWCFRPIHHKPCAASRADQPDSVSYVRHIVPRGDVGTVEAPLASRANRVGSSDESCADALDFIRLEPFGHVNEISPVHFELAIFERRVFPHRR